MTYADSHAAHDCDPDAVLADLSEDCLAYGAHLELMRHVYPKSAACKARWEAYCETVRAQWGYDADTLACAMLYARSGRTEWVRLGRDSNGYVS